MKDLHDTEFYELDQIAIDGVSGGFLSWNWPTRNTPRRFWILL